MVASHKHKVFKALPLLNSDIKLLRSETFYKKIAKREEVTGGA
jgi:hypothetical protein